MQALTRTIGHAGTRATYGTGPHRDRTAQLERPDARDRTAPATLRSGTLPRTVLVWFARFMTADLGRAQPGLWRPGPCWFWAVSDAGSSGRT